MIGRLKKMAFLPAAVRKQTRNANILLLLVGVPCFFYSYALKSTYD